MSDPCETVDYAALAEFRFMLRRFLAFSEAAASQAGFTSQQHQALLTIKGMGGDCGIAVKSLAERLFIKQHTAVELVDRLQLNGLIQRTADSEDRRRVLVLLTEQGELRLQALSKVHLDELRTLGPALVESLALFVNARQSS